MNTRMPVPLSQVGGGEGHGEVHWLELLWWRISALPWRSLALVPCGSAAHARYLLEQIAAAAQQHVEYPVEPLDATVVDALRAVETLAVFRRHQGQQRLLVAVQGPREAPQAVEVARAADVSVLVRGPHGEGGQDARLVMELVGFHHFVGCITLDALGRGRYA